MPDTRCRNSVKSYLKIRGKPEAYLTKDYAMKPKTIRRPGRLRAVWLSYWTRWELVLMLVVFSAAFALLVPLMWLGDPNTVTSAEPIAPVPAPVGHVGSAEQAAALDWSQIRSLTAYNLKECEPLWTPGRAPKLESLTILDAISDEQLAKLCSLYDLKTLTLYSPQLLTPEGWKVFQGETKLTYLRLIGAHALHNEPSLTWPPNLQTLITDNTHGKTQQRLDEWQRLPHLTTLSTWLIPKQGDELAPEMLDTLRRFPSLKRLYLVPMGKHAPNYVATQQAALPWARVRPAHYHPERMRRAAVIVIGGLLVLVLLSVQLSSQFVTTARVLTPLFERSHLSFVIGVFVALIAVSFGLLIWTGCSAFVALSLCGSSAVLLGTGVKLMSRTSGNLFPGFNNFAFALPAVVFPTMCVGACVFLLGGELDWILDGRQPWLLVVVLAGSVWGAYELIAMQTGLRRRLEESGIANVPMGMFNNRGWAEWAANAAEVRSGSGKKEALPYRLIDGRLDKFVAQHEARQSTTLLALWRLGGQSVSDMLKYYIMTLAGGLIFIGIPVAWLAPDWWSRFGPIMVGPMVLQLLGGGLLMPLGFAWTRRSMQELELLRPVSRRDWRETWFRGVAAEMGPTLLTLFGFGVVLWWCGLVGGLTAVQFLWASIIFIGIVANVYSVGMGTLTFNLRSQVPLVLFAIPVALGLFAVVLFMLAPVLDQHFPVQPSPAFINIMLAGLAVFLYGTAGLGLWLSWRRWVKWEVGMVA